MTVLCSVSKRSVVKALNPARNLSLVAAGRQSATPALITRGLRKPRVSPLWGQAWGYAIMGVQDELRP